MTTLEAVPNEILHQVLFSLSRKDLLATSHVSRRFHRLSQRPLYAEPILRSLLIYRPVWSPIRLLLRTLLNETHPGTLAGYVHSLTVELEFILHPGTPTSDIVVLTAAASRLGFHDDPLIEFGVQLVLLLRLLPRLTCLKLNALNYGSGLGYDHFGEALSSPTLPLALHTIREFHSVGKTRNTGVTPAILLALMGLPSIRTIVVSITDELETHESFTSAATAAIRTSRITELQLVHANIVCNELATLLLVPRKLTRFVYVSGSPLTADELRGLNEALVPLRDSLQSLCIDFDYIDAPETVNYNKDSDNGLGSLCEWGALRKLDCQLLTLLGLGVDWTLPFELANVLPAGLRELQIVGEAYYWSAWMVGKKVVELLESGKCALEKLSMDVGMDDEMLVMVERACENANVELVGRFERWW